MNALLNFFGAIHAWFNSLVYENISQWLTPVWVLSVGVAAGVVLGLGLWGLSKLAGRLPWGQWLDEQPRGRAAAVGGAAAMGAVAALAWTLTGSPRAEWSWLASAGAMLTGAFVGAALVTLARRSVSLDIGPMLREGPLAPITVVAVGVALFAVLGVAVVDEPGEMWRSFWRLPQTGVLTFTGEIPVPDGAWDESEPHAFPVGFDNAELRKLTLRADQPLLVSFYRHPATHFEMQVETPADGQPAFWFARRGQFSEPLPEGATTSLFVFHQGDRPARLTIEADTRPVFEQVASIPTTALATLAFFVLAAMLRAWAPKAAAVALATAKSEMAQLLFLVLLCLGVTALVSFIYIPYFTLGQDIKMLKDTGLTIVLVLCLIQAVWAASSSIADELESRTALTLLSKPLGRRDFILGKFTGIVWTIAVMFVVLSLVLVVVTAYKPVYEARESGGGNMTWQRCFDEMASVLPGLALVFMEIVVLTAISVAISTRLPMLANFTLCLLIYALGHLTPQIVQSSMNKFAPVAFMGRLFATVFPVLDHFNITAAIAGDSPVPAAYLGWALVYCVVYTGIALLLALLFFEDRDLA